MRPFTGPSFLGTFGLALFAIAALFVIDVFLARAERSESRVEAARLFKHGLDLMARGEAASATGWIQNAISIERENRDYWRTLAEAQLAAGRTADAEGTLTEFLQGDPSDGPASLTMARVLVKEGRYESAISYFHRAIYGTWNQDPAEHRLSARFELIDLLARHGSKEDLLAELLPVQEQAPADLATRIRIGRLFLQAGSPSRAEDVFRGILRETSANADAYSGLGQSEFARSDYRAAQRHFQIALRLAPDNEAVKHRLEVCAELLMLDPTIRGLSGPERLHRSIRLLELVLNDANQCFGQSLPQDLGPLVGEARKALHVRVPMSRQTDTAETNLDLAEQLWEVRKRACKPPPPTDTPLALVLTRIAQ